MSLLTEVLIVSGVALDLVGAEEPGPILRQQLGVGRQCVVLSQRDTLVPDLLAQLDNRLGVVRVREHAS